MNQTIDISKVTLWLNGYNEALTNGVNVWLAMNGNHLAKTITSDINNHLIHRDDIKMPEQTIDPNNLQIAAPFTFKLGTLETDKIHIYWYTNNFFGKK